MAEKRHKKHKHFLDHEEHEERLKNKFIVSFDYFDEAQYKYAQDRLRF